MAKIKRYNGEDGESEVKSSSKSFKEAFREARSAGDSTFEWQGKKYTTELAKESKPAAKVSAPEPVSEPVTPARVTSFPSGSLAGRIARSQGAVSDVPEPNYPISDKSAKQREETMGMFDRMGKKFLRYMGSQSTRDRLKAEGYAKGGKVSKASSASKRADGCAQRGKTRGRMV